MSRPPNWDIDIEPRSCKKNVLCLTQHASKKYMHLIFKVRCKLLPIGRMRNQIIKNCGIRINLTKVVAFWNKMK